jgi:hypothetical protein
MGKNTDKPAAKVDMVTPMMIKGFMPWRSAYRPAGSAKNTWESEKKASITPTSAAP